METLLLITSALIIGIFLGSVIGSFIEKQKTVKLQRDAAYLSSLCNTLLNELQEQRSSNKKL